MSKNSRKKFLCLDCKIDTGKIGEHYFVNTDLWLTTVDSLKGMLCIGCFEKRINRQLNKNDFTNCHINNPRLYAMSNRLKDRLSRDAL